MGERGAAHANGPRGAHALPAPLLLVRWPSDWDALGEMQALASRYARRRLPRHLAERIELASNELLENALRYAPIGTDVVHALVPRGEEHFEVRVTNSAVSQRIALLQRRIGEIGETSSHEAYRRGVDRLLADVDPSPSRAAGPGLGLLRVRHEADMTLDVEVDGRLVTVIATAEARGVSLPSERGSPGRQRS